MYCQHCGTQLPPEFRFCTNCGKPTGFGLASSAPDPVRTLQNHLQAIAILWAVYSIFRIVMAIWTVAFGWYFLPIWARMMPQQFNIEPFLRLIGGIYWASGIFAVAMGVLGLWAAWAIWQRNPYGRVVVLIVACISLISIPLGLALGIYTLVILLPRTAAEIYARLPAASHSAAT